VPSPPTAAREIIATPASFAPAQLSLDALVGRTLNNRYEVGPKIGEGGFGAVFCGKQLATGRDVALKILHPHNTTDPTVVARFRREAEASSQLQNAHAVTIYDFDQTEDGILYLAMELVRGRSLQQLQKTDGPLPHDRVLSILDQVAEALGEAHAKGVVHRDMKPENVMVDVREGRRGGKGELRGGDMVKVLDFGIAKIVSEQATKKPALTAVGQTLGTLEFMSPEQLRGKPLDGRSDLYALGIMAYEMLTGQLPFAGAQSPTEVIQFHLQQVPPAPSKLRPDLKIPPAVDEIVLKMVAKAREDRHADAEALRRDIQAVLGTGKTRKRALIQTAAVGTGVLVLLATVVAFVATRH
jgi:serine/threonine-protein kinase